MPDSAFAPEPAPDKSGKNGSKEKKPKPKVKLVDALREGNAGYKKLWPYIDKYRSRFIASIVAGAGSALLTAGQAQVIRAVSHRALREGAGALTKETVTTHPGFPGGFIEFNFHNFHDTAAVNISPLTIGTLLIFALLPILIMARCLCDYLETYYMTWVSLRVLHDLRVKIFSHILHQSFDFFNKSKQGSLISRVANDTRSAQLAITAVTDDIVTQPLTVIFVVANMLYTDWRFTFFSLCVFPLCILPISLFGKRTREIGREDETSNAELMVYLHEALGGIRLVKSLCREPYEIKRFVASSLYMIKIGMRVRKAMAIVGPLIESVSALGITAAFIYAFETHMEASKFIMLIGSLFLLYQPVKKLSKVHVSIQKALGATTKIFELLEIEPSIQDAPDATNLKRARGDIEFSDVTFRYRPDKPESPRALTEVSLRIPAGKSYALVGASGAGKSTIYSLLLRYYDPQIGGIRVDGKDIRTVSQKSLRENISIVSQDTFLFHETILENIRYGRLDATDEEIYEAARLAFAHDFILAQPQGYETIVGDKGCLISGGQQQRLAIARALLKNAPILLLDEATSALDSEAEQEIQTALARLAAGRTVISIAHRLSTILNSDQIVVMNKGEIVDIGPHAELLQKSTLYRHFYDLQFKGKLPPETEPNGRFEVVGAAGAPLLAT